MNDSNVEDNTTPAREMPLGNKPIINQTPDKVKIEKMVPLR